MLSRFSRVQLFATPWTIAHQAPLSMRFSWQEYWSELPCPPPGDLPNAGIKPVSLKSPALAGRLFTTSVTGEALDQDQDQDQFRSVTQSCLTLCNSMDCSTASPSITNSQSLLKLTSVESVMPSSHLILCHPLLLLPSILLSIGVSSNESVLHTRWPKYWEFQLQHQSYFL